MEQQRIKLVITHPSQLSERWVRYYCLDELCKVFDVEFWDCSALAFPSFKVAQPLRPNYLRVIHALQEFEDHLRRLPKDTVLITEVHHNSKTYPFHKIQGKYFPHFAHIGFYGNDIDRIWEDEKVSQSDRKIRSIKGYLYQSKLIRDFIKWLFHHNDADYKENRMRIKSADSYTECFSMSCVLDAQYRINHPDFEQYLVLRNDDRFIKEPYVVFVDQFYPYHPELFKNQERKVVDEVATAYHTTMNDFFDYVEKQYQCKVVIAAHPYANYLENNPFNGREVFYGKTALLIKDCKAVCIHGSNAYSFIALYDKPVAVITNEALEQSHVGTTTRLIGEKFNISLLYTDKKDTYPQPLFQKIENGLRERYIKDFLGDVENPRPNSELIREYIEIFHNQLVNIK